MAVYTELSSEELSELAAAFGLGAISEAVGIPQGSINTNLRLETASGRFFVRHTTVRSEDELRYEAALLDHLHASAFPAPTLVRSLRGEPFIPLRGGRVCVFHWLTGEEKTRSQLTFEHTRALGRELGKLHRVTNAFTLQRENPYGPLVVRGWLEGIAGRPEPELQEIAGELQDALKEALPFGDLVPRGTIHADLFLDNVKWLGDRVSAIFDFEMACHDALVLDVAITLNAWCFDREYQEPLCRTLLQGYEEERPFIPGEAQALYHAALFGAVRYTASRIRDFHLSGVGADRLAPKDFRTYLARVRALRALGEGGFLRKVGLRR